VNDAGTLMKRIADGKLKSASAECIKDAQFGLNILKNSPKDAKLEFAKKVEQTKGSKSFAWIRTFTESLKSKATTFEGVHENYYTRNVMPYINGIYVGGTWD
jgi:hypothetical protein